MATASSSAIPLTLLRHTRTVLSRKTDPAGKAVWVAEVPDMPWCRATGSSRVEALDRVREMGRRKRDDGSIRRRLPTRASQPDEPTPRRERMSWLRPMDGRDADGLRRGAAAS
ncbi:MAG TPA: hypothetical protein VFY04_09350 [Solirubrobacterales bacterium]|nr:hypothetical protein [Solirubrobacterales bacterium]